MRETQPESVAFKTSRKDKPRFIVIHEYSSSQGMRTAFEQAIETQACGQFEFWIDKKEQGNRATAFKIRGFEIGTNVKEIRTYPI